MRSHRTSSPSVSVILLDWSCRERFQALEWLATQDLPRDRYELIWVELYNRVVPQVKKHADTLITCNQRGIYHKHIGYNRGLLQSRGKVITICDSDAVFPRNFISSIIRSFSLDQSDEGDEGEPLVVMHHQRRSQAPYPDRLTDLTELDQFQWEELNHNVGACMSVRRADAIRFGGFDEHPSFRGYLCGPYDLGWRLVNAGLREVWHDPSVALWHFAHPRPADAGHQFSWRRWREVTHTHVDFHALTAVEAFSTGRLLPLRENAEIHELRMNSRLIGSAYERRYATMTGPGGFPLSQRTKLQGQRLRHPFRRYAQKFGLWPKRKPKPQESDE